MHTRDVVEEILHVGDQIDAEIILQQEIAIGRQELRVKRVVVRSDLVQATLSILCGISSTIALGTKVVDHGGPVLDEDDADVADFDRSSDSRIVGHCSDLDSRWQI